MYSHAWKTVPEIMQYQVLEINPVSSDLLNLLQRKAS